MSTYPELEHDHEQHERALTEASRLFQFLVEAFDDILGPASATIAVRAGRQMARKLPLRPAERTVGHVMAAIAECTGDGWSMTATGGPDDTAELEFTLCPIRRVCENRGVDLGGSFCKTYHDCLTGIATETLGYPVRMKVVSTGTTCRVHVERR